MKLGIDLGGTKIEAAVIDDDGVVIWRERQDTPTNDYQQIIQKRYQNHPKMTQK